jgi:hypothetical protein
LSSYVAEDGGATAHNLVQQGYGRPFFSEGKFLFCGREIFGEYFKKEKKEKIRDDIFNFCSFGKLLSYLVF